MLDYLNVGDREYAAEQMKKHKEYCRLRRLGQLPELPVEYAPTTHKQKPKKSNGYDPSKKVTVVCHQCNTGRQVTKTYAAQMLPDAVCSKCHGLNRKLEAQYNK